MRLAIASVLALASFADVCARAQEASQSSTTAKSPVIVKSISFTNQTDAVPQSTIYTPSTTGLYRVSIYSELITTNSANQGNGYAEFCEDLVYTNDSGATQERSQQLCAPLSSSLNNSDGSITFLARVTSNTPMLFSTFLLGGQPPPVPPYSYSMYITIERL
jgi:hypothetical protein